MVDSMAENVAEEYKSSLADLNCNSKPLINMLTILAEENIKFAPEIVKTIADHAIEVSPESKLPCLYLIDSIIKNVREQYLNLFTQNIVHIFASVFEKVDENTRMLLYKLRQTWNEIFPNKTLYNLDMRVKEVDPAWPVTAKAPAQIIHVNPKFLGTSNSEPKPTKPPVVYKKEEAKLKEKQNEVLQQLFAKQKQLRQLEQKKLELAAKQLANSSAEELVSASVQQPRADPRLVATLNPKLSQRDPRLQKVAVASVLKKSLAQTKTLGNQVKETAQVLAAATDSLYSKVVSVPPVSATTTLCDKPVSMPVPVRKNMPSEESQSKVPEVADEKKSDGNASIKNDKKPKSEKESSGKREQGSSSSPAKKKKKLNDPKKEEPPAETSPKKLSKGKGGRKSDSPKKPAQKDTETAESKKQKRNRSPLSKNDRKAANRIEHAVKVKKENDAIVPPRPPDRRLKRSEPKEDKDMRKLSLHELRIKREMEDTKENFKEPPEKKLKEEPKEKCSDSFLGHEDQDYRQLTKEGKSHHKGWAMYKAAHPDEFKSPHRPFAHGRDIENHRPDFEFHREKIGIRPLRDAFDRGPVEFDRLGRPRLYRMRRNERVGFNAPFYEREGPLPYPNAMVPPGNNFDKFFLNSVLLDPKDMLRQAEERYRLGRISEAVFNDIRKDLERMRCNDEFRKAHQDFDRMGHFGDMPVGEHENYMKGRNPENQHPAFRDFLQGRGMPQPTSVRTFRLDNKSRTLHFIDDRAVVLMDNGEPRELTFRGEPTPVFIQGLKPITLRFDNNPVEFELDGKICNMKFGTPSRELYINNRPYEAKFGGPPFDAVINGRVYRVSLGGPPPQVQVSEHPAHELYHKFLALRRLNPEAMAPTGPPEEALRDHSNKLPFDVDMRSDAAPNNRNTDLRDMDWRHGHGARENIRGYDFYKNGAPFPPEQQQQQQPGRSEPPFPVCQDQKHWDGAGDQEFRPFPPDQAPPRQPDWRNFPPHFANSGRTFSPHHSPPHDGPPGEWEQPPHPPPVSRPFEPMNQTFEPIPPQTWRPRDFNLEGPRLVRPPVSEAGNLFVGQRNSPKHFEPYPEFHEGEPRPMPPAKYPMPVMQRPPAFNPNPPQTRPEFIERPPVPNMLPRPPLPPWMNTPPPAPGENVRHPMLPPPPRPPLHMTMPFPQVAPPVASEPPATLETANSTTVAPLLPPPPIASLASTQVPGPSEDQGPPDSHSAANPLVVNLDVTTLFEKLVAAGIISKSKADTSPEQAAEDKESKNVEETKEKEADPHEEIIPPIEFKMENLKTRYTGVISALYRGSQCASCGMRFKEIHGERYSRHLDWHFRVNRREKDGAKKAFSRKWYYEVEDWIQFEEFENFEERARSFFELQASEQFQVEEKTEVPSVPVSGQETEGCVVCQELFQLFWVEEEEEWHLRNAVRHDGQAYHPSCYEDFKKASEASVKEMNEKESSDALESVAVKQEPLSEDEVDDSSNIISEVVEMLAETTVKSYEEAVKEESVKEEMEVVPEIKEEPAEEEVEEEEEEIELEGRPGEEEIIGIITEPEDVPEFRPPDSEKLVFQSGGIIMKVRAESLKPASPSVESGAVKEAAKDTTEESEEEVEFRPPTPDPRFQVLPPVQRGNELSGLCTIM